MIALGHDPQSQQVVALPREMVALGGIGNVGRQVILAKEICDVV
jgi:hypothetical protein